MIRNIASNVVESIDAGTCEDSSEQVEQVFEQLEKIVNSDKMYSLYESAKFLGVSERTLRNYVKIGKLRPPRTKQGWTEKFYLKEDLIQCKNNK